MSRLLIKLDNSSGFSGSYDESEATFYLSRSTWNTLKKIEAKFAFFARLNESIDVTCSKCGSFSVSCRNFFYALKPYSGSTLSLDFYSMGLSDEAAELLFDELWMLLNTMIEEKLTTDEEWTEFQNSQMLDKNLLYCENGDLIHREEGYPLGITLDDAIFKLSDECESCACYIR